MFRSRTLQFGALMPIRLQRWPSNYVSRCSPQKRTAQSKNVVVLQKRLSYHVPISNAPIRRIDADKTTEMAEQLRFPMFSTEKNGAVEKCCCVTETSELSCSDLERSNSAH